MPTRTVHRLLALAWLLSACTLPGPTTAPNPAETPAPTQGPASAPTPAPTAVPEQPAMAVVGPQEIVFDWTFDACEPEDIPDLPARAFRDADGMVHRIASHLSARAAVGPDFDSLVRDCRPIFSSDRNADPAQHNDSEWIAAVYTEDGSTVYATVHNEYHGWEHGGCAADQVDFSCWYNSLTLAVSRDGGASFNHALDPPGHFVAGLPYPYEAGAGPYGVFEPSSLLKAKDGFYYQVVRVDAMNSPEQWVCLMRTDDLSDPASWRAWDGTGFNTAFVNIYARPAADPAGHVCAPLAREQIGVMNQSLTYNSFLDRYVLLGLSADTIGGREVWGIFYSFSEDLLTWSHRRLLWERELPWVWEAGDPPPILYPTLIDPDSPSRSFDVTGQTVDLYFTVFNPGSPLDRDLVRVPVAFFKSEAEAAAADTRAVLSLGEAAASHDGLRVDGLLANDGGVPLAGQAVDVLFVPEGGPGIYGEYTLTGLAPPGAEEAVFGYRMHMECDCEAGPGEVFLYDMRFNRPGDSGNLVLNPDFSGSLSTAVLFEGAEFAALAPSDRGAGTMVHVAVGEGQAAGGNLANVPVSGGERFTAVFGARIPPDSAGTGVFVVIFTGAGGEIQRFTARFEALPEHLGSAQTGPDGRFAYSGPGPGFPGVLRLVFPGAGAFLPAEIEIDLPGP